MIFLGKLVRKIYISSLNETNIKIDSFFIDIEIRFVYEATCYYR